MSTDSRQSARLAAGPSVVGIPPPPELAPLLKKDGQSRKLDAVFEDYDKSVLGWGQKLSKFLREALTRQTSQGSKDPRIAWQKLVFTRGLPNRAEITSGGSTFLTIDARKEAFGDEPFASLEITYPQAYAFLAPRITLVPMSGDEFGDTFPHRLMVNRYDAKQAGMVRFAAWLEYLDVETDERKNLPLELAYVELI